MHLSSGMRRGVTWGWTWGSPCPHSNNPESAISSSDGLTVTLMAAPLPKRLISAMIPLLGTTSDRALARRFKCSSAQVFQLLAGQEWTLNAVTQARRSREGIQPASDNSIFDQERAR